ncbi:hypothetical protein D3C76_876780 [compost metagenome]
MIDKFGLVRLGSSNGVVFAVFVMKPSTLASPAEVPDTTEVKRSIDGPRLVSHPSHPECPISM